MRTRIAATGAAVEAAAGSDHDVAAASETADLVLAFETKFGRGPINCEQYRVLATRDDGGAGAVAVVFEAVHDAFADSISSDEPTFRLFRESTARSVRGGSFAPPTRSRGRRGGSA